MNGSWTRGDGPCFFDSPELLAAEASLIECHNRISVDSSRESDSSCILAMTCAKNGLSVEWRLRAEWKNDRNANPRTL